MEVLDQTSLTIDEFELLVPWFEEAFQRHMREWTLEGRPRQGRRYSTYVNCPLPTPEDRLLFVLVYLKHNPLQVLHGRLFGLRQPKAHQWLHVLLPVLRATLESLRVVPSRALAALGARLGLALAAHAESGEAPPPLFAMMARSGRSPGPRMRQNRRRAIAARKSATP
jgi:hypothetical protein